MVTKSKLYIIEGSEDSKAAFQLAVQRFDLVGAINVVWVNPNDKEFDVNAVMIPLVVPTLELENGKRYEGIVAIKKFLEGGEK